MDESRRWYWTIRSRLLTVEGSEVVRVVRGAFLASHTVKELTKQEKDQDWYYYSEPRPNSRITDPKLATEIWWQESQTHLTKARKFTKRDLKIRKYFKQWEERRRTIIPDSPS